MSEYSNSKQYRGGACNPTPTSSSVPTSTPKTLDEANAADNLKIKRGSGKKDK